MSNREQERLIEDRQRTKNWKRWGPYLSERQWGTVREDYSLEGAAWEHFAHDYARSRAYRWGEDGLLGITDRQCRLCFALALWNEKDAILKERLFGLTGNEGNHGEDVKEEYFYLDSTPTHSYMKALYKYPQTKYPYGDLLRKNREAGIDREEFELHHTRCFESNRYFDVFAEYAKADDNDLLIKITLHNRGTCSAPVHLLPTLWFRNTWTWGCEHEGCSLKPRIQMKGEGHFATDHETLGEFDFYYGPASDGTVPTPIFTENDTNPIHLPPGMTPSPYVKDGFHEHIVKDAEGKVNPEHYGTKSAPWYKFNIPGRSSVTIKLRLRHTRLGTLTPEQAIGSEFDSLFKMRLYEADQFYGNIIPGKLNEDQKNVMRQSYAGLLWTKQFYHYIVKDWLKGDPNMPPPPKGRWRNKDWKHLHNRDIISMPDKWEYPWYAAWDLAFHMIPFARLDPDFAKGQLTLFLREWYMHPNGQIPAYEWAFNDVNPPVHAWAVYEVYKMTGAEDTHFLATCFQKLLLNFNWWVNRKDPGGKHLFSGGFLGLDNIGVFDRNRPLPSGHFLNQADGTAWMAFYALCMLQIAMELAKTDKVYSDMASKFFEHFVAIADAMNEFDVNGLWDDKDGFYYDHIHTHDDSITLRVRSMVGLIPLYAVAILDSKQIDQLPNFKKRMQWFLEYRKDLSKHIAYLNTCNPFDRTDYKALYLLAIPSRERLEKVLNYMVDETEFLADHGIRSMSKHHQKNPFSVDLEGEHHSVQYTPGTSRTWMFGGNSNWRGPIWFPLNWLLIESLMAYDYFYQDTLLIETPKGSGNKMRLRDVAVELAKRLTTLFTMDENGRRPCNGDHDLFKSRDDWKDLVLFHEFFHGDNGAGLGAAHQTGWTALVNECFHVIADPAHEQEIVMNTEDRDLNESLFHSPSF